MRKCSICKKQFHRSDLDECPCGFMVCAECQDYGVYTDEICCNRCAAEIRKSWRQCKRHKYGKPYENDDGQMVKECFHCGNPRLSEVK